MTCAETAPVVGWELLLEMYRAKWVDIVADTWWTYLDSELLDVKWRRLLFVALRDAFLCLCIDTTNGIELVWRVFEYDWLLAAQARFHIHHRLQPADRTALGTRFCLSEPDRKYAFHSRADSRRSCPPALSTPRPGDAWRADMC